MVYNDIGMCIGTLQLQDLHNGFEQSKTNISSMAATEVTLMAATATAVSGDRCRASWNSCTMPSDCPLATAHSNKQNKEQGLEC